MYYQMQTKTVKDAYVMQPKSGLSEIPPLKKMHLITVFLTEKRK